MAFSRWFDFIRLLSLIGLFVNAMLVNLALAEERETIHFSCTLLDGTEQYRRLNYLYRTAFDRLGYNFSMNAVPGRRGLAITGAGAVDGDCSRLKVYSLYTSKDLLFVDALVGDEDVQVWSRVPDYHFNYGDKLPRGDYKIGYSRGVLVVENYLNQQVDLDVVSLTSSHNGIRMLHAGRLDFYIDVASRVSAARAKLPLGGKVYLAGSVMRAKGYPHLHKRYRHLVEPLGKELRLLLVSE